MQVEERTRERLRRAFSATKLDTVTPEELLEALRGEGIDSYERLVEELLNAARDGARTHSAPRLGFGALTHETRPSVARHIVHRVPKIPLTVDGIGIEPREISHFDGRVLNFVAGPAGFAAFTDTNLVLTWLRIVQVGRLVDPPDIRRVRTEVEPPSKGLTPAGSTPSDGSSGSSKPEVVPAGASGGPFDHPPDKGSAGAAGVGGNHQEPIPPWTHEVVMYRDVSWRGRTLVLESGRGYDDLTELSMDWFSDWNDKASSLASSDLIGVYGEHTNFEGSRLVVKSHTPYENLGDLGWNDRISSALAG